MVNSMYLFTDFKTIPKHLKSGFKNITVLHLTVKPIISGSFQEINSKIGDTEEKIKSVESEIKQKKNKLAALKMDKETWRDKSTDPSIGPAESKLLSSQSKELEVEELDLRQELSDLNQELKDLRKEKLLLRQELDTAAKKELLLREEINQERKKELLLLDIAAKEKLLLLGRENGMNINVFKSQRITSIIITT